MRHHTDEDFSILTGGRPATLIVLVEHRGMLLTQFQELWSYLASNANDNGEIFSWTATDASPVLLHEINLYLVTTWVIKPLTRTQSCSYVEAVTTEPALQMPSWFISHWWGEAVKDFITCITRHIELRGLSSTIAYWVCAYANCQHQLGTELGRDPMQSSFLKAMEVSDGVLLILDPNATPFNRIWCCFEAGIFMLAARGLLEVTDDEGRSSLQRILQRDGQDGRRPRLLWDIGTVERATGAKLLIDGLTAEQQIQETKHCNEPAAEVSGFSLKSALEAEQPFPLEVLQHGFQISITDAQASITEDYNRILNCLAGFCGEALEDPPDITRLRYKEINCALRARFAHSALRPSLRQGRIDHVTHILSSDTTCVKLVLDLSDLPSTIDMDRHLTDLSCAISHLNLLKELRIDCRRCRLKSADDLFSCLSRLQSLRVLKLNFMSDGLIATDPKCLLSDVSSLGVSLAQLHSLDTLYVDFSYCFLLTSIDKFTTALLYLTQLSSLYIGLSGLFLEGIESLASSLSQLVHLTRLNLILDETRVKSIGDLGQSFTSMSSLRHLYVNLRGTRCLGLSSFAGGIKQLSNLSDLRLELGCIEDDVTNVLGAIGALKQLSSLKLGLEGCMFPFLEPLSISVVSCSLMHSTHFNFRGCGMMSDLASLKQALQNLPELRDLVVVLPSGQEVNTLEDFLQSECAPGCQQQ